MKVENGVNNQQKQHKNGGEKQTCKLDGPSCIGCSTFCVAFGGSYMSFPVCQTHIQLKILLSYPLNDSDLVKFALNPGQLKGIGGSIFE
jgi:hypothetical protein